MLFRSKFLLLALALLAAACGLKGPLYRPDEPKDETTAPATDASGAKKKQADSDRPAGPPGS